MVVSAAVLAGGASQQASASPWQARVRPLVAARSVVFTVPGAVVCGPGFCFSVCDTAVCAYINRSIIPLCMTRVSAESAPVRVIASISRLRRQLSASLPELLLDRDAASPPYSHSREPNVVRQRQRRHHPALAMVCFALRAVQ